MIASIRIGRLALVAALAAAVVATPLAAQTRVPGDPHADDPVGMLADACPAGDARCAGRPEMLACSGTGVAACVFTWRRGGALIEVGTVGEEAPSVSGVRCRSGCR